jgi:1-acyl-sn-glycerol-3-phosphate acyltransferase
MRLNPIAVLKEKESALGPEAGKDPLPLSVGAPLDPLYKVWSVVGAWPLSLGLMTAAFGISVPLATLVPFEKIQIHLPQPLMGLVPRVINFAGSKRTYHPGFDPKRVSLFVMNHTSILDAHVACWVIPHSFCGVQHAHHFNVPVYGWLMKKGNGIGVEKGGQGQAQQVAEQVHDRVRRGISILGFPEGRRTQNGRILPYRRGLFMMARDSGIPVVNVSVRGLWQILRRGEWVVRPHPLDVYVGPQVETAGMTDDEVSALAERCHRFTADFVERGVVNERLWA